MPFEVKTLSVLEGRIFEVEERLEAVAALLIREHAVEPRVYRVGEVRRAVRTEGYVVDEELAGVAPRDKELPLGIHLRTRGGRAPILAGLQEYLGLRPRLTDVAPEDRAVRGAADKELSGFEPVGHALRVHLVPRERVTPRVGSRLCALLPALLGSLLATATGTLAASVAAASGGG